MTALNDPRLDIQTQAPIQHMPTRLDSFEAAFAVGPTLTELVGKFLDYSRYELRSAERTVQKQRDCLSWIQRDLPHIIRPEQISLDDVTLLKKRVFARGASEARANSMIFVLRAFLRYCRKVHMLTTLDPKDIAPVKIPRRRVLFLTPDEIRRFLAVIPRTLQGGRFMALVQVLLATGMRISEALSLNRNDIDWERRQATIIGKGNKERTVFFSAESLEWLKQYLAHRHDNCEALFATFGEATRLKPTDVHRPFKRYRQRAGITKKLTPHILRHTMATTLSHNGCDIKHIRDLLGHSDISITADFYLGTDDRVLRDVHERYLRFVWAHKCKSRRKTGGFVLANNLLRISTIVAF